MPLLDVPFIQKAIDVGVPLICAHKGISAMVDNGSPRDVGPVAHAFPQVDFLIPPRPKTPAEVAKEAYDEHQTASAKHIHEGKVLGDMRVRYASPNAIRLL